jgi:hypothetical protein
MRDDPCSVMPVEGTSTVAIERASFSAAHRSQDWERSADMPSHLHTRLDSGWQR